MQWKSCSLARLPLALLLILLYLCTLTRPANAQTLEFTLLTPNVVAGPGVVLTFQASLTNTGAIPLFLNNDFGSIDTPLFLDDAPFQTTFLAATPLPTLAPDGQPRLFDLFTISLPADPALYAGSSGVFQGSFTLFGGATEFSEDELGSQTFTVTLRPGSLTAPEPGTFSLLFVIPMAFAVRFVGGIRGKVR